MFEAIVFLSLVQVLLACSPVAKGKEKYVYLQVTKLDKIPVQFAWGKTEVDADIAANEKAAKKKMQQVVKNAVVQIVKEEAIAKGINKDLAPLDDQINSTVYYVPLQCGDKIAKADDQGITCAADTEGWCCTVSKKMITKIEIPSHTKPSIAVIEPYKQLIVELSIGNAEVAKWKKEQWTSKMANVEGNLRNHKKYGEAFQSVKVKVLGVYSAQ